MCVISTRNDATFLPNMLTPRHQLVINITGMGLFLSVESHAHQLRRYPDEIADISNFHNSRWPLGASVHYRWPSLKEICDQRNPLRPSNTDHHFADSICIFLFFDKVCCILIQISLQFVPNIQIDNKLTLVQVIAWFRLGDKPLPAPILIKFSDTMWRHQ